LSSKTINAPRRLAFFYFGPPLLFPRLDGLLVALYGAARRALVAPAQPVPQDAPDVALAVGLQTVFCLGSVVGVKPATPQSSA
jgi:hypothetical protein